ncbi:MULTISPECIES: beta/gamma crystallin-related protein [unclassified Nostoc]|uniref:beta/gamma crystallin-related protein n=1 Tax=unclassified Nostoc TaxID=2593658 RepID=UPI0025AA69A5|nr:MULTISPECIES: beta/gamma crystallin-related protein [unclassified Nostoc]MDM9586275.1 beta/gamma crystallin-related protein [Nostoc sp. GT001]MDZ7943763.1 beta/gamma crystallin-related protein [Nostoc sp. EfeVER01]MDZ7990806.1 beta/gamma crystallin-related protein [Nostoc sp. EspVER01]
MSNINNHGVDMNNDLLFQELSGEKAATIQGGYALELYQDANFQQPIFFTDSSYSYIGDTSNDQTSSIIINQGTWAFYTDADFQGTRITLGVGAYPYTGYLDVGNDTISSFYRLT